MPKDPGPLLYPSQTSTARSKSPELYLWLRNEDRRFISDMANDSWIDNTGINYLIEFSVEIIKCSQQTIWNRINGDKNAEEPTYTCQACNKLFHTLRRFADM
ncbi:hypothetical protein RSOLAG1IB_11979 [Rhizoctonia solani AG-1 IB]|uniref:Uncharacterized protein n=1 Tax=Thanatephorus cucumeris (strain AG1-IB / isolate 7/3/14) TaxID=1108050 RepID=M5C6G4_THACB|nr:hypothetical protein BN14_08775 [Rhizoctonia solani AG-1 IB]CEL56618.1 hypothetical protein RSOLAG1IB_11979 [Rhizoctonia solani AG-1 IB]